ncbi:MAG TPA: ankyrin repeat domain-containing protein [Anaeromyxobacteraceae bacterium]|nr:ankyrin repeat domain-containing protein [Anaeromyxobacteraceae bacterium]
MLAALLLAVVGGAALLALWWRASVEEREVDRLVRRLIDLAVRDPAEALRLLREHPELRSARTVHDATPLHFCALEGQPEGVRFFADAGVPLDAVNDLGDTALVDAVAQGNVEVAKLLLRKGADPDAVSPLRGSALGIAQGQGNAALVALLRDAGARG